MYVFVDCQSSPTHCNYSTTPNVALPHFQYHCCTLQSCSLTPTQTNNWYLHHCFTLQSRSLTPTQTNCWHNLYIYSGAIDDVSLWCVYLMVKKNLWEDTYDIVWLCSAKQGGQFSHVVIKHVQKHIIGVPEAVPISCEGILVVATI